MLPVLGAAVLFAAGVWLIAASVWPAPRPLTSALTHLHSVGRERSDYVSADGLEESVGLRLGRWLVRRLRTGALVSEQTAADLELLARPVEVFVGTTALSAIMGALLGPVAWGLGVAAGTPMPVIVPMWLMIVGGLVGWFLPRLLLRNEATEARASFRHALGAYLDVLVLLLAAQEGPESAMDIAAQAGQGRAFDELRRATWQARLSGDAVWDTLDVLGRRVRVPELREIAAAGSLAGESGAAVRQSLTAKARALRQASLAEAETTARKRSQAMFMPLVLMGMGFVVFLIYPMLTNLSFSGT